MLQSIDGDFQRMIPLDLHVERDTAEGELVAQRIRDYYIGDQHINNGSVQNMMDVRPASGYC